MKIKNLGAVLCQFAAIYDTAGATESAADLRRLADALSRHGNRDAREIPVILAGRDSARIVERR